MEINPYFFAIPFFFFMLLLLLIILLDFCFPTKENWGGGGADVGWCSIGCKGRKQACITHL
jgi:hypothetical protein